jgi:uncharacterized DUF497 family protein
MPSRRRKFRKAELDRRPQFCLHIVGIARCIDDGDAVGLPGRLGKIPRPQPAAIERSSETLTQFLFILTRIISARKADKQEREEYVDGNRPVRSIRTGRRKTRPNGS